MGSRSRVEERCWRPCGVVDLYYSVGDSYSDPSSRPSFFQAREIRPFMYRTTKDHGIEPRKALVSLIAESMTYARHSQAGQTLAEHPVSR